MICLRFAQILVIRWSDDQNIKDHQGYTLLLVQKQLGEPPLSDLKGNW